MQASYPLPSTDRQTDHNITLQGNNTEVFVGTFTITVDGCAAIFHHHKQGLGIAINFVLNLLSLKKLRLGELSTLLTSNVERKYFAVQNPRNHTIRTDIV